MNQTPLILIGALAVGAILLGTKKATAAGVPKANNPLPSQPIGTNDFVRGYLPPNVTKYLPNSVSGAASNYVGQNNAGTIKAIADVSKSAYDLFNKIETGNPKTPSSNPNNSVWDSAQVSSAVGETATEDGNPLFEPDTTSPDYPTTPVDAPDFETVYYS